VFLIVQAAMYAWNVEVVVADVQRRIARLLGIFVAAAFYLVVVHHATNLYFAREVAFETFILRDGGLYPLLLWGGYALAGTALPLLLLLHPRLGGPRATLAAAGLVVLGAFAWLYAFIIGGQAFPLEIFPGHAVSSSFGDGAIATYTPRWPEWLLGIGGLGVAFVLTVVGVRVLDFMPRDDAGAAAPAGGKAA
jgi:molybdopterin-containing oxidoreductase family membrane subunit